MYYLLWTLSEWSLHFVSICHDILPKSIYSILSDPILWICIYLQPESYMLLHPWRPSFESRDEILFKGAHSNLGTRFCLRGEGCDTPGVSFMLCRENCPNLGRSVKFSIFFSSRVSPFIKLLVKVSPISDFSRSPEGRIWSRLKLLILGTNANLIIHLEL
jgi:hypothetical protein